jgi:folate-binding protein YgfZ
MFQAEDCIEWTAWGEAPIVNTFGHPQAEYAAIRKGTGLMDLPQRGVIELAGPDRASFLNNLLTNALLDPVAKQPIPAGHGCYAFFLNLKGRIVADLRVLEVGGDRTLLECDRLAADMLVKAFDLYLFGEKVKLRDRSSELHELALHGLEALSMLDAAVDAPFALDPAPPGFPATFDVPSANVTIGGAPVVAWREDLCGVPGVHLLVDVEEARRVWDDLVGRFGQAENDREPGRRRLRRVGWAMFNACRIEAGMPLLGVDFAAAPPSRPGQKAEQVPETRGGTLPAETGPLFARAVSLSGGCYLGQEVVARMHARSALARQVVGIRMDEDALPAAGVEVEVDGQPAGLVTSSTLSPVLSNACIALAMIKRPHFAPGTRVTVPAEGRRASGTIVELPFLR